jgi:hypothetical protein
MAKYLEVTLGRLVRETASVVVMVPDDADNDDVAREIYDVVDGEIDLEWDPDEQWGADEGTHTFAEISENAARGRVAIVANWKEQELEYDRPERKDNG